MRDAIQKAIEGGWKPNWYFSHFSGDEVVFGDHTKDSENNPCYYKDKHAILLDPLFWQCLFRTYVPGRSFKIEERIKPQWIGEWHKFIDHLSEGKDVDEFFTNLTK